ncbi:MAG: hypothetical protein F9B45_16940 [Phycisphaera sp. RhM]|nr:hypothetical protein [Phycisphaera sp. RhM]
MTMSSDQLTHNMAQDFFEFLTNTIGLDDAPADEFFDPIAAVFGNAPTQASVVAVFKSHDGPNRLASKLNDWLETNDVTDSLARQLLEITIVNNFGPDVIA